MRFRLGKRFTGSGRELSVLDGMLTTGTLQQRVRIMRRQDDDDEALSISVGAGPPSLAWSGRQGALSNNRAAAGTERSLIERLALDGPDQFVLAQLRGASYFIIARNVPQASGDYVGPTWDLVRVGEPESGISIPPLSAVRVYYINSTSGLIEKVISREPEGEVTAEILAWSQVGDELVPSHTRWLLKGQVVMDLSLSAASFGSRN